MDAATPVGGLFTVFTAERAALLRFLRARGCDPAEAEDLLQDLWLRLSTAPPAGPVGHPRAYLFRMAANLMLDDRRARGRAMARDRAWLEADGSPAAPPEARADPAPDAETALLHAEERDQLRAAIAALPPGAARALRLCRIEGLPQADAARIMGISRSGVEKHLANALRLLRISLDPVVNADCGSGASAASERHERGDDPAPRTR